MNYPAATNLPAPMCLQNHTFSISVWDASHEANKQQKIREEGNVQDISAQMTAEQLSLSTNQII